MKYETTKKAVMNGYVKVINGGYYNLDELLKFKRPIAYTTGIYGHNADIYDFGCYAIATGQRPFGNVTPRTETLTRYKQLAQLVFDGDFDYIETRDRIQKLLEMFIDEVTQ